MGLVNVLENLY